MQIVLFIIDNSASMGQRCYLGTRLLDVAKGAVETFIKLRSRDPASRNDRYMLVTLDDFARCIRSGWKETHAMLINKLKYLKAEGLTTLGQALRTSFDLLSVNRLVSGIDTYGQGRSPFFLEPAMIVAITDGGKLSNRNGVQQELHLPMNDPLPGSELTKEPFRWDQRLFSLVLRLPSTTTGEPEILGSVPSDPSPISLMCEVTGGRSYSVTSQKTLMQCLESLVQKVQGGVVINFECIDPEKKLLNDSKQSAQDRSTSPSPVDSAANNDEWASLHRMIYVKPSPKSGAPIGHWPLPEAFWPDHNAPSLPPRTAHPILRYSCVESEPLLVPSFPYDKYELEASPLTQVLLEKKNPNACWPVFVDCSGKYSTSSPPPCGYLKASSNLSCVNLFVMPYNYPEALPLVEKLIKQKMQVTSSWRLEFDEYLKSLPSYYVGPFRKAMRQLGVQYVIPENFDIGLSHSVLSYFKKLKQQAKISAERLMNSVSHDTTYPQKGIWITGRHSKFSVTQLPNFNQILASVTENAVLMPKLDLNDFPNFHVTIGAENNARRRMFHNPYDIPRSQLLDQIRKMRINLRMSLLSNNQRERGRLLQDKADLHNQPMSNMGNYQDYLRKSPPPLRELDPDTPKRLHTFGNPFKLAKEKGMLIDETEDYDGLSSDSKSKDPSKRGRSRKRSGSIPRPGTPPVYKRGAFNLRQPPKSPIPKPPKIITPDAETPHNNISVIPPPSSQKLPEPVKPSEEAKVTIVEEKEKPREQDITPKKTPENMKSIPEMEHRNQQIREKVIKLIRKPGKRDDMIFGLLQKLKGPKKIWHPVICRVIKEAHRFKRDNLIEQIKQFEIALEKHLKVD